MLVLQPTEGCTGGVCEQTEQGGFRAQILMYVITNFVPNSCPHKQVHTYIHASRTDMYKYSTSSSLCTPKLCLCSRLASADMMFSSGYSRITEKSNL